MKKKLLALVLCACLCMTCALGEESARNAVDLLARGEYQTLFDGMSQEMRAALQTPEGLAGIWAQLTGMFGAYEGASVSGSAAQGAYTVTAVTCEFQTATVNLNVVTDESGLLSGLSIAGYQFRAQETPENARFSEEPIALRAGQADETQGLITVPAGDGPFPCAVLLQGSGPSDMNETAYGISVFRELAHLLAERGVASLRFDKYTYAHPENCAGADFTVDDEYLYDAQAALSLLEADARFDRTLILGHSLGAMVAPRVMARAQGAGKLCGAALIAGSPYPLWRIMECQNRDAIARADLSEDEKALLNAQIDAQAANLHDAPEGTAFGLYAHYLLDQAGVDAAQTAMRLKMPLFIAQGGKDFQVPLSLGLDAWREALQDMQGVTYALYPDMTHLLFDLEGESAGNPQDYAGAHTLNARLADDIAQWVQSIR